MGDIVPRDSIVKYGMNAAGGVIGGILMLSLRHLPFVPALIVGGIFALAGLLITRSREDRTTGSVLAGAGILIAVAGIPVIGAIAGFLMVISGIGLLAIGVVNIVRFFKGLRSRQY
jgi:hypothetical protein